jgi:uncharacterized membrane protein (UPF0127 family)
MLSRFAPALFALLLVALPAAAKTPPPVEFPVGGLTIERQDGDKLTFTIEVATTPEQQMRGLMFRETMAANAGMLFLYPEERIITMWMKNTILPLDMIFADRQGRVVSVHANAVPFSEDVISSRVPAMAVLEINAGQAARLGIKEGDRLIHAGFKPR